METSGRSGAKRRRPMPTVAAERKGEEKRRGSRNAQQEVDGKRQRHESEISDDAHGHHVVRFNQEVRFSAKPAVVIPIDTTAPAHVTEATPSSDNARAHLPALFSSFEEVQPAELPLERDTPWSLNLESLPATPRSTPAAAPAMATQVKPVVLPPKTAMKARASSTPADSKRSSSRRRLASPPPQQWTAVEGWGGIDASITPGSLNPPVLEAGVPEHDVEESALLHDRRLRPILKPTGSVDRASEASYADDEASDDIHSVVSRSSASLRPSPRRSFHVGFRDDTEAPVSAQAASSNVYVAVSASASRAAAAVRSFSMAKSVISRDSPSALLAHDPAAAAERAASPESGFLTDAVIASRDTWLDEQPKAITPRAAFLLAANNHSAQRAWSPLRKESTAQAAPKLRKPPTKPPRAPVTATIPATTPLPVDSPAPPPAPAAQRPPQAIEPIPLDVFAFKRDVQQATFTLEVLKQQLRIAQQHMDWCDQAVSTAQLEPEGFAAAVKTTRDAISATRARLGAKATPIVEPADALLTRLGAIVDAFPTLAAPQPAEHPLPLLATPFLKLPFRQAVLPPVAVPDTYVKLLETLEALAPPSTSPTSSTNKSS